MDDDLDSNTLMSRAGQFKGTMKKYWAQRYLIFSKYDSGALLTKELWYSVTPEALSKYTAKFINEAFCEKRQRGEPLKVMDAFCGGGGNIIQFLNYNDEVYAADINKIHLHCTYNNASLYVDRETLKEKLVLLPLNWEIVDYDAAQAQTPPPDLPPHEQPDQRDDFADDTTYATVQESLESLEKLRAGKFDCIFGSPPWGGPEYMNDEIYNLDNLLPYTLEKLLRVFLQFTDEIVLFLPRNSDLDQIKDVTNKVFGSGSVVRVLRISVQGRPKGLVVCWGQRFAQVQPKSISMS